MDDYLRWIQSKFSPATRTTTRNRNQNPPSSPTSNRRRRKYQYRVIQTQLKKKERDFARNLLSSDNGSVTNSVSPTEEMRNHFQDIFSTPSIEYIEPIVDPKQPSFYSDPVSLREVEDCLKEMRCTAPGLDGMKTTTHARQVGKERLCRLYNGMLLLQYTPEELRKNKVNSKKATQQVFTFYVSCILLRIFHRILAKRMSSLCLNISQRGF